MQTGLANLEAEVHIQGTLFDDDTPANNPDIGFRGPTACRIAGITYRQLDYWARKGLVEPSVQNASGSGTHRLYSFRDVLVLKVFKRLLDTGISLDKIEAATEFLRERGVDDLAQITLMSDGDTVYECTSDNEVIDLLKGGQGVFAIALGPLWRETEGTIADLPAGSIEELPEYALNGVEDELAARRLKKIAA